MHGHRANEKGTGWDEAKKAVGGNKNIASLADRLVHTFRSGHSAVFVCQLLSATSALYSVPSQALLVRYMVKEKR